MEAPAPRPDRYCPLAERDDLPFEVARSLPTYGDSTSHARIVRRCLCSSVAHAGVPCSPDFCVPRLLEAEAWAATTQRPAAALGGAAKRIWRQYGQAEDQERERAARDLDRLIDQLLEEDE